MIHRKSILLVGFPGMIGREQYLSQYIMRVVEMNVKQGCFFGLILFNYLMHRPDGVWGFGRFEKDGVPIESTTYFEIKNPPSDCL